MKLFITFVIILLLAATPQPIASSSLAAKDVQASLTEQVSLPTPSQALKLLALDDETHKKVVDRADPLKVAKFVEIHKLFKENNVESTVTENEEVFYIAVYYVPCEIAWHLRIIEFDEAIQCLEKSASWKATAKVGDKLLVNLFADKYTFELTQLLKTTDLGDDDLFLNIQKMVWSEGFSKRSASIAFFLQHALTLYSENPTSSERREMVSNFLSLHLSAVTIGFDDQRMLRALYNELVHDVPTLLSGGSLKHAIVVAATRTKEDEYDIVLINSGAGIENHESTTEIQPKGFHTGASYDDASTSKRVKATSYNPLLRMKGITGEHLALAHYHDGTIDEIYYVVKHASSHVVTEPLMPWEWTESQGIGSCAATSVWFALRFYYQALAYENDLRLSMLGQAISDLKELQDRVEDLERQLNAHYQEAWEAFKKAHTDYKKQRFDYDQSPVKGVKLAKDNSEKSLHLRRTIISMALNEILRNLIVWHHELGDIDANMLIEESKDKEFIKSVQYSKMMHRREALAKAIPQTMVSFHSFWALQEEKYAERQKSISEEAELSSVLDSWHSIREDVRTMYNDAIKAIEIKPAFEPVLTKEIVAQKEIDVGSLDEHSSLAKILGYILNFGDSPALRQAISEHTKAHTKNANAAKYLIVLYACLTKNVPLLDHLVVKKELPLRYKVDRTKRNTKVSMHWDLRTEQSIAALAAHGFAKYGQPLNSFPELFRMSEKETQGIVSKFKDAYKRIAPIINAEKPLQGEIDKTFTAFVKRDRIAAIAYILPKVSTKAVSDAFFETANVRVLRLLVDLVKDSELLREKIEANIRKNKVKIVQLLLPACLRYKKHAIEKDILEKQIRTPDITGKLAKVSLPDRFLDVAYNGNAVKVMQFLASLSNKNATKYLFLRAAKDRKYEMVHALARYVTGDTVSTAIKEAKTSDQGVLTRALRGVYTCKKRVEDVFLKTVERGNLHNLKKWMPSVSVDTIGDALSKAAEKGKMDCFEKLVPHSTDMSTIAALSKLSEKNLKHPSVLKAVNNASRLLAYKEIIDGAIRASNVELIARMLPFMSSQEVTSSFVNACKSAKSFEVVKQLFQFVQNDDVDTCLNTAVEGKMEEQVKLLLPRLEREKLAELSRSLEFEKLGEDTRQAIENRIKNFPAEVAIQLAFLPKDVNDIRKSLETELEKYNTEGEKDKADLACKDQQSCIDMMKQMDPSAWMFPVEQATAQLLLGKKNNAALEKLLPFATPYACTETMLLFSEQVNEKAAKDCAGKALREGVLQTLKWARDRKNFELMKSLLSFLSPLQIVELLEQRSFRKIGAKHVEEILSGLPSDLADDALRIAVRGDEKTRGISVFYLLPKASQAAIDEVYLFAKRIKFDDELLEESASETAKAQGKEVQSES